jgi:hypothetical protein
LVVAVGDITQLVVAMGDITQLVVAVGDIPYTNKMLVKISRFTEYQILIPSELNYV